MAAVDWSGIATVIGSAATFVSACGLAFSHFRGDHRPGGDPDEESELSDLQQQLHVLQDKVEQRRRRIERRKQHRAEFVRIVKGWVSPA